MCLPNVVPESESRLDISRGRRMAVGFVVRNPAHRTWPRYEQVQARPAGSGALPGLGKNDPEWVTLCGNPGSVRQYAPNRSSW